MAGYDLAQYNIARLVAPLDSPELADFMAALDPLNALADGSPGFVWRHQTEDGNSTSIRVREDHHKTSASGSRSSRSSSTRITGSCRDLPAATRVLPPVEVT